MRVLCVDDHTLFRKGLVELLSGDARFTEIRDVSGVPDALAALDDSPVDLLVVDLALGKGSGFDLLQRISVSHPAVRSVVLTMFTHETMERRARSLGCWDYIAKDISPRELRERLVTAAFASSQQNIAPDESNPLHTLSARQLDVFRMLGQGLSTREVADRLMVSPKTVETHRMRIKAALGIEHVGELVALAARLFPDGS